MTDCEGTILIVDDEPNVLRQMSGLLGDYGYSTLTASCGKEALDIFNRNRLDLILLDLQLPDIDGMEVLKRVKTLDPDMPVVMISAYGTIADAVKATKLGAYDFIEKPPTIPERLMLVIEHAVSAGRLRRENVFLRKELDAKYEMVGQSKAIRAVYEQVMKVAPTNSRVLIMGETGTGKELVARAIHENSTRSKAPFIKVNCAAIPEELIESELFGHEKGSFTGASSTQQGKFELADGGTIFLDEIGDMSLSAQAKVLRTLQENEIQRVGGRHPVKIDVRVISATNKNLEHEISKGRFRHDLYYRLNVVPIRIPPLRERKEDIPLLARHFLREFCQENGWRPKRIDDDAMALLCRYDWPGNVREIKNIIERLSIIVEGDLIRSADVARAISPDVAETPLSGRSLREMINAYEKKLILEALERNNGNITHTAHELQVDRANLHRKLKNWGI